MRLPLLVALASACVALSGCDLAPRGGEEAPRPAGSAVPVAAANAESAGSEPVPQTWRTGEVRPKTTGRGAGGGPGRGKTLPTPSDDL